jgi:hypothetical protein
MPDLYSSSAAYGFAVNAQKTQPSSLFGTRKLKFFVIGMDWDLYHDAPYDSNNQGLNVVLANGYTNPDSVYSNIVNRIQASGELYYLGAPDAYNIENFVFGIADETGEWEYNPKNPNAWPNLFEEVGAYLNTTPIGNAWGWNELVDVGFGLVWNP